MEDTSLTERNTNSRGFSSRIEARRAKFRRCALPFRQFELQMLRRRSRGDAGDEGWCRSVSGCASSRQRSLLCFSSPLLAWFLLDCVDFFELDGQLNDVSARRLALPRKRGRCIRARQFFRIGTPLSTSFLNRWVRVGFHTHAGNAN